MKIAHLFLVYDRIEHEAVWRDYLAAAPAGGSNVYVHAKPELGTDELGDYFAQHLVADPIQTSFGDLSIVRAMAHLLRVALDDDRENTKFVFVSGSCVPIKHPETARAVLLDGFAGRSVVSYFAGHSEHVDRTRDVPLPRATVLTASQWLALERRHAAALVDGEAVWSEWFRSCQYPDEHWVATYLAHTLGPAGLAREVVSWDITYKDWRAREVHPATFHQIDRRDLDELLLSPYLFARKFPRDCVVVDGDRAIPLGVLLPARLGLQSSNDPSR